MRVALTFDDGPDLWTPELLDVLAEYGQTATFFVLGERISRARATFERTIAEGHEIGVHGYTHRSRPHLDAEEVSLEFAMALAEMLPYVPVLWRPPHHATSRGIDAVAQSVFGLRRIGADLDPGDWKRNADEIMVSIHANAKPADIIDMHDGVPDNEEGTRDGTVEAVRRMFAEGYTSVAVSAL